MNVETVIVVVAVSPFLILAGGVVAAWLLTRERKQK